MHEGLADSSAPERLRGILVLEVFRTQGQETVLCCLGHTQCLVRAQGRT